MRTFIAAAASFSMITASLAAADLDDGWRNLWQVTRGQDYAVILRDGHCSRGPLVSVNDQSIALGGDPGKVAPIQRADILRIADTPSAPPHDAIFSGRSSWIDVEQSDPKATEYLLIVTNSGQEWKWKQPAISDEAVRFEGKTIAKAEIRLVSYVRFKPLTRRQAYFQHESVSFLAPKLWFGGLFLGKISVLLYNAALAEDNSPVGCE